MKIKNTSGKLVNVGETVILPGATAEVAGFDNNAVVAFLVKQKVLTVIKDKPARGK